MGVDVLGPLFLRINSYEREIPEVDTAETTSSIQFPALRFSAGLMYAINSLDHMSQCTRAGFKSGCYEGAFLIHSNCQRFNVVDARKVRTLFRLSVFDLLGLLEGNPRWQVEFVFKPAPTETSFDEAKQFVFRSFKKEKDTWEEMVDFEQFRDQVVATTSMPALFEAFREFNQL
jgi:hypothetical protein